MTHPLPVLHCIAVIAVLTFFIYAAVTDMKRMEVPVRFLPFIYLIALVDVILSQSFSSVLSHGAAAGFIFFILYLMARFEYIGGGDTLAIPLIALLHGLPLTLVVLIGACFFTLNGILVRLLTAICNSVETETAYPFMPGVAASYAFMILIRLI